MSVLLSSLVEPLLHGGGRRHRHDLAVEPLDRASRGRRRRPWRTIRAAPSTPAPAGNQGSHRTRAGSQTVVDDPQPALVVETLQGKGTSASLVTSVTPANSPEVVSVNLSHALGRAW